MMMQATGAPDRRGTCMLKHTHNSTASVFCVCLLLSLSLSYGVVKDPSSRHNETSAHLWHHYLNHRWEILLSFSTCLQCSEHSTHLYRQSITHAHTPDNYGPPVITLTPALSIKLKRKQTFTHSICFCFLTGSSAAGHHWLQNSHPALLIWKTGSHEVQRLTGPTCGVRVRLQLQHVRDICTSHKHNTRLQWHTCTFMKSVPSLYK